jgi:hypothetical protein
MAVPKEIHADEVGWVETEGMKLLSSDQGSETPFRDPKDGSKAISTLEGSCERARITEARVEDRVSEFP